MRKEIYNETAPKQEERKPERDFDDEDDHQNEDSYGFERKPMWREGQDGFKPRESEDEFGTRESED